MSDNIVISYNKYRTSEYTFTMYLVLLIGFLMIILGTFWIIDGMRGLIDYYRY